MKVLGVLLCAFLLAGCADPSGPTVNNSGDGNFFNFSGDAEGDQDNDVETPAPVVITPVVIAPESEEPPA